ncbi:MAG: hypothetical protein RR565_02570 [Erysipelothrix sp.]
MTTFKIACQILSLIILIAIPVFYFVKFRKEKLFMKDVLWGFILSMAASVFQKIVIVSFPQVSGSTLYLVTVFSWLSAGFGIVLVYLLLNKYIIKTATSKIDHLIMGFGFVFLSVVQSIPTHISFIMISISDMSGNGFDAVKNMLNTEDVTKINELLTFFREQSASYFLGVGLSILLTLVVVTSMLILLMKFTKENQDKKVLIIPVMMMSVFGIVGVIASLLNLNQAIGLVLSILLVSGIGYYAYKEYKTI